MGAVRRRFSAPFGVVREIARYEVNLRRKDDRTSEVVGGGESP